MSRGWKGSEVMAAPQPAHSQLPVKRGFSPETGMALPPKSSLGAGSPATSAKSGMSGASVAKSPISEAAALLPLLLPLLLPPLFFIKQLRQVRPASLRG